MQLPEKQFLEALISRAPANIKNRAARAVFDAIQEGFDAFCTDSRDLRWMTDPDMVGMLSVCASLLLEYLQNGGGGKEIDLLGIRHDFILTRTIRGFMNTLVVAIRKNGTVEREGEIYFRSFLIPRWFVKWAKDDRNVTYEDERFYPTPEEYDRAI